MVIVLSWFGIISLLLALVPVVAISPILLYIGMLIGAQAFQTTPAKHAPAIVLALTPHLAAWCKTLMDGALGAAGTSAAAIGMEKLGQVGVLYHGLEVLGGGSILTGLVLGAVGVFVIERKFQEAAAFALRRRGAHLFRLHARRSGRHRRAWAGRHALGRARLYDRRRLPVRAQPRGEGGRGAAGATHAGARRAGGVG